MDAEIYQLIWVEKLHQDDVASRLGMTQGAISKRISRIRARNKNIPYPPLLSIKGRFWRYHALHFVVKPYYFYPRYDDKLASGGYSTLRFEWRVRMHEKVLELQLRKGYDFASPNKYEAMAKAEASFNRALDYLSHELGFEVWKDRKCNIELVREHLAQSKSPLAKARKGQYLQIRGIDGKVWFLIDKSKHEEHEYVKANCVLEHSDKIEPFLNDWLYMNPPTNSQLAQHIQSLALVQSEYNQNIIKHLHLIDKIGEEISKFGDKVQVLDKEIRKLRLLSAKRRN